MPNEKETSEQVTEEAGNEKNGASEITRNTILFEIVMRKMKVKNNIQSSLRHCDDLPN